MHDQDEPAADARQTDAPRRPRRAVDAPPDDAAPTRGTGEGLRSDASQDAEARLRHRYPRGKGRIAVLVVATLAALALVAWLIWAGLSHAFPDVSGQVTAFKVTSDEMIMVQVDVERRDTSIAGECLVVARDAAGGSVGEQVLEIPAGGEAKQRRMVDLATIGRAETALINECRRVS